MKIYKRFPITEFAEVDIDGEKLLVKFKFPTYEQSRLMALDENNAQNIFSTVKYCIEEISNLEDEEGQKIEVKAKDGELPDEQVNLLNANGLGLGLWLFYHRTMAPKPSDKKKSQSSEPASEKG